MFRLLPILAILLFITCLRFDDTNPFDPDYAGTYYLKIHWPDTLGTFIEYNIPYSASQGKDSLVKLEKGRVLDSVSESSLFHYTDKNLHFMFKAQYTGPVSVTGYSMNETPVKDTGTITVICPFLIESDPQSVFGKTFFCSLTVDSCFDALFTANPSDSVVWQYADEKPCTLSFKKNFSVSVNTRDSFSITAFFIDSLNNKSEEIMRRFFVTLVPPRIDSIQSEIKSRVGTVNIPVWFSDDNDSVGSIFYKIENGTVNRKKVDSNGYYTLTFEWWNTDTTKLYVWVKDGSGLNSDTAIARLILFIPDSAAPYIKLKNPDVDSSKNMFNSAKVEFVGSDNYGIKSVICSTSVNAYMPAQADSNNQDTSYWSVTITGLKQNQYLPVWTSAVDSFDNTSSFVFFLYYDSTLNDVTDPKIEIIFGPTGRVLTDTGTFELTVSDLVDPDTIDDGIDTVFYSINSVVNGHADSINDNTYRFAYKELPFHGDTIIITAIDGSGTKNKSTKSVILDYNTYPTSISTISPQNSANSVETYTGETYTGETYTGVTYSWTPATDADGDIITYTIHYGLDTSSLDSFATQNSDFNDTTARGGRPYYWYVNVSSGPDVIRCPAGSGYYTFTTRNHPAIINGLNNDTLTINDTITFNISASDREGILQYIWYFGDDSNSTTTNNHIDSVTHIYTSASVYTACVFVVDSLGDTTKDSAYITITNKSPIIDALPGSDGDTLRIGYNDSIYLAPSAIDDGKIVSYEWSFDGGNTFVLMSKVNEGDTSFLADTVSLPKTYTYVFKARDEDNNSSYDTIYVVVDMLWSLVTGTQWIQGRVNFAIAADSNTIYVMGGLKGSTIYNDVFKTGDGTSWNSLNIHPDSCYTKRYSHAATTKNDTLYILGGDNVGDIWRSVTGGITWDSIGTLKDVDSTYSLKLTGAAFVTANDSIFLIGGNTAGAGISKKVYMTHNCNTWKGLNTSIIFGRFPASGDISSFFNNDTLWVLAENELWYSYAQLLHNFGDLWVEKYKAVPGIKRIVVYGKFMYGLSKDTFKYSNDRGLTWFEMTSAPPWKESTFQRFAVFKNEMWVITDKGIWHSADIP